MPARESRAGRSAATFSSKCAREAFVLGWFPSSIDTDHGLAFAAAYCASKGAVKPMTGALAKEWVRYHITVNCVAPGFTDTDLFLAFADNEELEAAAVKHNVPMRRFAQPEEIAVPVVYLASDQASYVTGESIVVDGGVLA